METLFVLVKYFLVYFFFMPNALISSTKSSKFEWLFQKRRFIVPLSPPDSYIMAHLPKISSWLPPPSYHYPYHCTPKNAAKEHWKQSPLLSTETFQLSVNSVYAVRAVQFYTQNGPNADGNCVYSIKLQSAFLTFLITIKSFKYFTGHLKDCRFAVWLKSVLYKLQCDPRLIVTAFLLLTLVIAYLKQKKSKHIK